MFIFVYFATSKTENNIKLQVNFDYLPLFISVMYLIVL